MFHIDNTVLRALFLFPLHFPVLFHSLTFQSTLQSIDNAMHYAVQFIESTPFDFLLNTAVGTVFHGLINSVAIMANVLSCATYMLTYCNQL